MTNLKINQDIQAASTPLATLLSPLGHRLVFPPDIPFQAAQARGKTFNATIGQITDGYGKGLSLPSIESGLSGLEGEDRNRAILYSPVQGDGTLRETWRRWQRRNIPDTVPSSLPLVTAGLTHGLSLVADIFGGEGRAVVVPTPFWGNYRQVFETRTGAEIFPAPAYKDGAYNTQAIPDALSQLAPGRPAVAILNIPSNPGGYSPTVAEREELVAGLLGAAEERPLLVLCDDAYAGLVFDASIPRASLYWDLVGRHPNLIPVKVDGATKELSFFGGRVGFITFPFDPDTLVAAALESKVKCLVRSTIGSPVASSQRIVLASLQSPEVEEEAEAIRLILEKRYLTLQKALKRVDTSLIRPLPSNAGCFTLMELTAEGIHPETLRQHLLNHHDTGLVAIEPHFVRIAFCSVAEEKVEALVHRLEAGIRDLLP